jgi:hypothetical protein
MSLSELLVAAGLMLTVTAAAGTVLSQGQRTFRVQPEVADMQQRVRVAAQAVGRELQAAGGGLATTPLAGPLVLRFPPVAPYRRGHIDDARDGVFYRPDAISVVTVAATRAEAAILRTVEAGRELLVDAAPNCGALVHERVCGFVVGMRVVIFDDRGLFDVGTVTGVAGDQVRVQHGGAPASLYNGGAAIAEATVATYALRPDPLTGASQLVRYDGVRTERPVVDNVVGMQLEYFGDPRPPHVLPAVGEDDPVRPATSYGPAPPPAGVDDPRDAWGPGENCVFVDGGGTPIPRLAVLGPGRSPVLLDPARLRDGPWCPDAAHPARFDADLLRVRRIRFRLRVQVAVAAMRGPAGRLFARGGSAVSADLFAPDQQIVLDVTPRNLAAAP